MHVALQTVFKADRKEPLAAMLARIHAAIVATGMAEPHVRFTLTDPLVPGSVSAVARALKRHPELDRFRTEFVLTHNSQMVPWLCNGIGAPAEGETLEFATLLSIASGIPRSFPFNDVRVSFHAPDFGRMKAIPGWPEAAPGVTVGDDWWINGRTRFLSAVVVIEADPATDELPALPRPVDAVLATCGKIETTRQIVVPDNLVGGVPPELAAGGQPLAPTEPRTQITPETAAAIQAVVQKYRAQLHETVARAALPHDLPSAADARVAAPISLPTGPKKSVLAHAFKRLGYSCTSGSGDFTLRRRTPGNLTVEVHIDVGTWSRKLTATFRVLGLGFRAPHTLLVSKRELGAAAYPISGPEGWQQLVDNLAALVAELDRSFVPEIEAAAGSSPAWYEPEA